MKKIFLSLLLIVVLVLLYSYVGFMRNTVDKILLPSSYDNYAYLYENKVQSEDYRISKVIDGVLDGGIKFNSVNQEFIVFISDADYDRNNQGWETFWKVDKKGKAIDSLSTRIEMHDVGIFFESTYYIDWVYSGNKAKQEYKQVFDFDSISSDIFKGYIEQAENIAYGGDYEKKTTNCYLKIKDEWLVFESSAIFNESTYRREHIYFKQQVRSIDSLLLLEDRVKAFQKWRRGNANIYLQKFIGEWRASSPFLDLNNTSRSGWNGTGYFRMDHHGQSLFFKGYTFDSSDGFGFDTDISVFDPQDLNDSSADEIDISFLVITKHNKSRSTPQEKGIYVISKKDVE